MYSESTLKNIGVIDLFCGIGGLSHGMKQKGFDIIAGFDIDKTCKYAYEFNNTASFFAQDVETITKTQIDKLFKKHTVRILAGCAPCQPFSSYAFKHKEKDSKKYDLLYQFGRLVEEVLPDIVTMENVAQILSFKQKPVLQDFIHKLNSLGYHVSCQKVYCPDYGIPQTRKRIVLLASRLGPIQLIPPTHNPENYVTVKDAIGDLPPLQAGETYISDSLHRARSLSEINQKRIKATPYGGGWKNWPSDLRLKCHSQKSGTSFGSVYGRMVWEKPSPTMTTLCTGIGNGRFGHPEQNRAISLREAARFQTFPDTYKFFPDEQRISITKASRYIGNAVPPKLGEITAISIINHLVLHDKIKDEA
ncbi:DNA cytosine methyltransferase [Alistipes finegoldii]|uniref:DNA cytosine methyltransferase n=2 Tax=Alistipes finegoldii TaxID=214856 RepID=UPI0026764842|nr:DNA (cytosine-5-)-methyltransferase [Alistipes finegoldii]